MMGFRTTTAWSAALLAMTTVAASVAGHAKADGATTRQESASELTGATKLVGVRKVLTAYEVIRGQLARDEVGAVEASARELRKVAEMVSAGAPAPLRKHLIRVASTARRLSALGSADAGAVRKAFGETSRHIVALLVAEPALRKGLNIFRCPMAQGYKKWVQPEGKLANPYMGAKMLRCGSASDWQA